MQISFRVPPFFEARLKKWLRSPESVNSAAQGSIVRGRPRSIGFCRGSAGLGDAIGSFSLSSLIPFGSFSFVSVPPLMKYFLSPRNFSPILEGEVLVNGVGCCNRSLRQKGILFSSPLRAFSTLAAARRNSSPLFSSLPR